MRLRGPISVLLFLFAIDVTSSYAQRSKAERIQERTEKKVANFEKRKWNVCSVTINSDDEIKVLRRKLPADQFNFVELTDFAKISVPNKLKRRTIEIPSEEAWFQNACESNVECHVLVISGHFTSSGRTFYGSSPYKLSLKSLQSQSCADTCKGILSYPLEVYLFGCNTLNNSCGTGMTEEQFRRQEEQMIAQGGNAERARVLLNSLRETMGKSVKDTMKEVFSGVKSLYGFDGIAPSGKLAKGPLEKTVEEIEKQEGSYNAHLEKKLITIATPSAADAAHQNDILQDAFKYTVLAQCSSEKVFLDDTIQYTSGVKSISCGLIDPNRKREDRFRILTDLVGYKKVIDYLPSVAAFLSQVSAPYSESEQKVIDKIKKDPELKQQFITLVDSLPLSSTFEDALTVAQKMGWLSESEKRKHFIARIKSVLEQEIHTDASRDYVCSLAKNKAYAEIFKQVRSQQHEKMSDSLFSSAAGLDTLACLSVSVPSRMSDIRKLVSSSPDPRLRSSAFNYLLQFAPEDPENMKIVMRVMFDKNLDTREDAFYTLTRLQLLQPDVFEQFLRNDVFKQNLVKSVADKRNQNENYEIDLIAIRLLAKENSSLNAAEYQSIFQRMSEVLPWSSKDKADYIRLLRNAKSKGVKLDLERLRKLVKTEITKHKKTKDNAQNIVVLAMLLKEIGNPEDQSLISSVEDLSYFSDYTPFNQSYVNFAFENLDPILGTQKMREWYKKLLTDADKKYRQGTNYFADELNTEQFYANILTSYASIPGVIDESFVLKVIAGDKLYGNLGELINGVFRDERMLPADEIRKAVISEYRKISHPSALVREAILKNLDREITGANGPMRNSYFLIDELSVKDSQHYSDPEVFKKLLQVYSKHTTTGMAGKLMSHVLENLRTNDILKSVSEFIVSARADEKHRYGSLTLSSVFSELSKRENVTFDLVPGSTFDQLLKNEKIEFDTIADTFLVQLILFTKSELTSEGYRYLIDQLKTTKSPGYWALARSLSFNPAFNATWGKTIAQICKGGMRYHQFQHPFQSIEGFCSNMENTYLGAKTPQQ